MKASILALLIAFTTITAHAEVQFNRHGTANVTTAADGVLISGTEADVLYDSLNVPVRKQDLDGPFKGLSIKLISFNHTYPATGNYLVCERTPAGQTDCYLAKRK